MTAVRRPQEPSTAMRPRENLAILYPNRAAHKVLAFRFHGLVSSGESKKRHPWCSYGEDFFSFFIFLRLPFLHISRCIPFFSRVAKTERTDVFLVMFQPPYSFVAVQVVEIMRSCHPSQKLSTRAQHGLVYKKTEKTKFKSLFQHCHDEYRRNCPILNFSSFATWDEPCDQHTTCLPNKNRHSCAKKAILFCDMHNASIRVIPRQDVPLNSHLKASAALRPKCAFKDSKSCLLAQAPAIESIKHVAICAGSSSLVAWIEHISNVQSTSRADGTTRGVGNWRGCVHRWVWRGMRG